MRLYGYAHNRVAVICYRVTSCLQQSPCQVRLSACWSTATKYLQLLTTGSRDGCQCDAVSEYDPELQHLRLEVPKVQAGVSTTSSQQLGASAEGDGVDGSHETAVCRQLAHETARVVVEAELALICG